jgi:hypothetical protein
LLIPCLGSATNAYWSTSGTVPWLYLAQPTGLVAPTSASTSLPPYYNTSTSLALSARTAVAFALSSTAVAFALSASTSASPLGNSAETNPTSSPTTFQQTNLTIANASPTATATPSLICGDTPLFTEIPTAYDEAHCNIDKCLLDCQYDGRCKAFGYIPSNSDCLLFDQPVYYPAQASGTGSVMYWNLACVTPTSFISATTSSA